MITAPKLPGKVTIKATDSEIEGAAKAWIAAKVIEDAGKVAEQDRKDAASILDVNLASGDIITINGNESYLWDVNPRSRTNDKKILEAVEILHPGVSATIARLKLEDKVRTDADKKYATEFNVYSLKPAKR